MVLKSPIFDAKNFANDFSDMLWKMWSTFKLSNKF